MTYKFVQCTLKKVWVGPEDTDRDFRWVLETRCSNPYCEAEDCPGKRTPPPQPPSTAERLTELLGTEKWIIIGDGKPTGKGRVDYLWLEEKEGRL